MFGSVGVVAGDGGTPPVFCTLIACRYPEGISVILFAEALFALVQNLALIVRAGRSYPHGGSSWRTHFLCIPVGSIIAVFWPLWFPVFGRYF